jgi:hypothetical protein
MAVLAVVEVSFDGILLNRVCGCCDLNLPVVAG